MHLNTVDLANRKGYSKPYAADQFETPFGRPDPRLVAGEGFGNDVQAFQAAHEEAWEDQQLGADTPLVVELFELVEG